MILSLGTALLMGATVHLPMEATARGTEIELAEIASIEGTPAEVALLEGLELGYAPAPGYSRLLKSADVAARIAQAAPELSVRVTGHPACRVRPEVRRVEAQEIRDTAARRLARELGSSEASFRPRGDLADVLVPAGARSFALRARPDLASLRASGTVGVPVDLLIDGATYRTVWTSWDVDVWQVREVLTRDVKAGEELSPRFLARRRVRTTGELPARPVPAASMAGTVAARDLLAGEVVTEVDLHRPTVITLGETAFLLVRKGAIEARVPALALESGSVGERIRVRTIENPKEFTARVIGADLVSVDLGR